MHIDRARTSAEEEGSNSRTETSRTSGGDTEFDDYVADMLWAQDYALANREQMMDALLELLFAAAGAGAEARRINCHHNYSARERHEGRELWITRKGAIRARAEDKGVIPGSMATGTYIVRGRGSPASYDSSAHGAGRRSVAAGEERFTSNTADTHGGQTPQLLSARAARRRRALDHSQGSHQGGQERPRCDPRLDGQRHSHRAWARESGQLRVVRSRRRTSPQPPSDHEAVHGRPTPQEIEGRAWNRDRAGLSSRDSR